MRLDGRSFSGTKDQTIGLLNRMVDDSQKREYRQVFYSQDRSYMLVLGVQPDGKFGIEVYKNDGDNPVKVTGGMSGITTFSTNATKQEFQNNDYIKTVENDGKQEIIIQDSYRIETLKSVYPIGSIYENESDSTNPSDTMNWGESVWESIGSSVILTKNTDDNSDPTYRTVYRWKRLS